MDPLDLNLTLTPPHYYPEELEENNVSDPYLTLRLRGTINVMLLQSPPSLSTILTLEGEGPHKVQPKTAEEVSPFSVRPPPSSAERSCLFASTSPILLPIAIDRCSLLLSGKILYPV
ncbi:hypothetical protein SLE2022_075940 [Rubroshorea leprosula]